MSTVQVVTDEINGSLAAAAAALAASGPTSRSLGIINDSHDRKEILSSKDLANSIGTRIITPSKLSVAATAFSHPEATHLLASLDNDHDLRTTAMRAQLLARINSHLKGTKLSNTMALATMFRDVLVEMDHHEPLSIDRNAIYQQHSAYEAEIVVLLELWDQLCQDDYLRRRTNLDNLARTLTGPVVYLHWSKPYANIIAFLQAAAKHVPTTQITVSLDSRASSLEQLWASNRTDDYEPNGPPPNLYNAETLEEAARAVRAIVHQWYNKLGPTAKIGLVGYDRMLVRRIHSLFLQEGLLITDRSGWLASNLLVGNALLALAAAPQSAKQLAQQLSQILAHRNSLAAEEQEALWWELPRHLANPDFSAQHNDDYLNQMVERYCQDQAMPPGDWFALLAAATTRAPLAKFFTTDPAGEKLRNLLHLLAEDLSELSSQGQHDIGLTEIRRLLYDTLSETHLLTDDISSTLQLVTPGRFSSQTFDALLMIGPHADNLPHAHQERLFNDEVRRSLSLPTREEKLANGRQSLAHMVASHDLCSVVWHGPTAASPYLELMQPEQLPTLIAPWNIKIQDQQLPTGHHTVMQEPLSSIGTSSMVHLMNCPYKFHSEFVLKIKQDRITELGQRDVFGTFVHTILFIFHEALSQNPELDIKTQLLTLSQAAANGTLEARATELGLSLPSQYTKLTEAECKINAWEWQHYIDEYTSKIQRLYNEADFIGIAKTEEKLEMELPVGQAMVTIRGICDRIDSYRDQNGQEYTTIVDIKTTTQTQASKFKDAGEYPQLPLYIAMSGTYNGSAKASYWVLAQSVGKIILYPVSPEYMDKTHVDAIVTNLGDILTAATDQQHPMPANGVDKTCQYCPYEGLCRKGYWLPPETNPS